MKRVFAFTLTIFIVMLSIFIYCPVGVYANDDFTLSKSYDSTRNGFSLSSSESTNAINNKGDIYTSDHLLMFMYTPTSNYNWTSYAKNTVLTLHFSDSQLKNILMSSTPYENLFYMIQSLGNTETVRGLASYVGYIFTGKSDMGDKLVDTLTNNYNYLDAIDYNQDTQTITMSNDNGSVDKLREEIKKYYYDSIGIRFINPTDNHNPAYLIELNRSLYDYEEDYISDFNALSQYDYAVGTSYGDYTTRLISGFDKNSYSYCYLGSLGGNNYIYFLDKDMNVINDSVLKIFNAQSYGSGNERIDLEYSFKSVVPLGSQLLLRLYSKSGDTYKEVTFYNGYTYNRAYFFSKNNKPFVYFSSYEKLYNFLNGSQTAYLSSRIDKAGEDITFSIKDMNENLGSKMDTLIDSINDKKGSMTADELQNAIDKGIENLNKNTEDIKDNTSDILDVLREQNQILLDILGVTTNIYKVVKESDSKEKTYNINYVQSVFNSMFKGLKNAVLYGENTVRDDVSEDTDDIDSIVSDISPDKKNYHNGLFGRFPFSVPYQLFDWLQALYVEPVAPKFTLSYAYLFRDLGYETNNFEFVIDLGDEKYSKWIELVRSGEKLSFIIYMAIATYHRFKNEI